jgi:hypothetical protein
MSYSYNTKSAEYIVALQAPVPLYLRQPEVGLVNRGSLTIVFA